MEALRSHPVADLFPPMTGKDFDDLVADIRDHGLLQPIWLHQDGSILDGRNRYRACREAGVEAQFRTWTGSDVVQFVTSANLRRRNLTLEQRAFIAAELANMKITDTLKRGPVAPDGCNGDRPLISRAEAASTMQVTPRSVERARAVEKHAPDLKPKVISGEMSLTAAAKEATGKRCQDARNEGREAAVERGKAALRKKRHAERLHLIGSAIRKLRAWVDAYAEPRSTKPAAHFVRQAIAVLEKERG